MRQSLVVLLALAALAFGQLTAYGHAAEIKQHLDLGKGFTDTAKTHSDLAATQSTDSGRKTHNGIANDALKSAVTHFTLANNFASDDAAVLTHTQLTLSFAQEAQKHADLAAAAPDGGVATHVSLVQQNLADSVRHMNLALGQLPSTSTEPAETLPTATLAGVVLLAAALVGWIVFARRRMA